MDIENFLKSMLFTLSDNTVCIEGQSETVGRKKECGLSEEGTEVPDEGKKK